MSNVFSTTPLFAGQAQRIVDAGHDLRGSDAKVRMPRREILAGIVDAEGLLCLLGDRIDEEVLRAGRSLRIVANIAVGHENVDVDAARRLGITVTNTPDVLTEATADMTFALLLAAARRIPEADASVRAGRFPTWRLDQPLLGLDVHGKTLGILGMGRIG